MPMSAIDPKFEEFFNHLNELVEHLSSEDPLGMVIRGHLYIESEIIRLIEEHFPHPEKFDLSRLTFPAKLDLASAMGLFDQSEEDETMPYVYFNRLRNKLAHNLNQRINADDILHLYESFNMGQFAFLEPYMENSDQDASSGLRQCIIALYIFLYVKRLHKKGLLVDPGNVASQYFPGKA